MPTRFQRLTRPMLRRLAPGGTITEHGITFERLANGDGVFTVNIMVDGQRIHRVLGRESDGTTRTQAEEFIEKVRRDAREGRLNLPKGRKIALGFREAATRYLDKLAEEGGKDLVAKRRRLTLHLIPFFEDMPLSNLSTFDVERYKKARLGEGSKAGTINRELAALSHLLTKAIEWQWIDKRPARLKRLAEDRGRIVYLTVEQAQRLVTAAMQDQNPHIYPFVVIGLGTSMRKSEILSIRREYVDIQHRVIYIPRAKAGAREQPITAQLAVFLEGYLDALPEGSPWLFPSLASHTGHTVDIRGAWRRVIIAAGLEPSEVVPHTLRHTAITHLVQAGVDLPTVKRISGHKTLLMVERYSHQNGAHIEAAMDALEARYTFKALPTAHHR
jgi:integrase